MVTRLEGIARCLLDAWPHVESVKLRDGPEPWAQIRRETRAGGLVLDLSVDDLRALGWDVSDRHGARRPFEVPPPSRPTQTFSGLSERERESLKPNRRSGADRRKA